MLSMFRSIFQRKVQWVINRLSSFTGNNEYAAELVTRVQAILSKHGEKGCVESDFVPYFKLAEMDLVQYTLNALWMRNAIKREVRYYIRPIK